MHVRRSRGALSGILLVVLGAWVALIPYVGPAFNYAVGPNTTWDWTAGRLWLSLLPGVVTVLAGLVLLGAGNRGSLSTAGLVASLAGMWIVVGGEVSRLWNDGVAQSGAPYGGNHRQVLEVLGYSLLSGAAIAAIGAFAFGRSTIASVSDVRYDLDTRQRDLEAVAAPGAGEPRVLREPVKEPVREPAVRTTRHHLFHRHRDDEAVDLRPSAADERRRADAEDRIAAGPPGNDNR